MNYSTTEFKKSAIARKSKSGPVAMIFITVVVMAAMFAQFAHAL